jgi:Na+-translocating ferredoxin:NAD+ oxidoreductase subunit A
MVRGPHASRLRIAAAALLIALLVVAGGAHAAAPAVKGVRVEPPHTLRLELNAPIARTDAANFRLSESSAPDVPLPVVAVRPEGAATLVLTTSGRLLRTASYELEVRDPPIRRNVKPSPFAMMFTAILSAALINNFVFTRYLGLCVFFGVSKQRDTSTSMGVTFTAVMVLTGMLSWLLYMFVMKPLQLSFLQVLAFIGIVAFVVQLLDTILKKTHRALHRRFGIYLVLITTNCIILAVPLLNAAADATALESFALALGSGFGFALALFLMSCAREKVELARVPASFQGLPIAFVLAGLFALAFMGFSGLSFTR